MPFSVTRDLWLVLKARDEGTRALRSFSRDIRMVGDSVREANLRAARSALSNQLAQQKLSGASQNELLATQRRIAAIDDEIGKMRVYRASQEESRVSALKLGTALNGAASMMTAAGTAMTAAGVIGAVGLRKLIDSAIEYQKQSALTQTQVEGFALSLRQVEDIGLRVAKAIGAPFESIQPALYEIFSSMEIGAADAEKILTTFAKAAVAGQTDIQTAQKATIGILNAFQLPLSQVNHLMDLQFQLVQEGVGTYEEWTQRIGLVTPSAARAGQSVETMLAALAATTRMGISAARSATAVARAFDAMSHPVAVKAMKEMGVNALDATGHFRPLVDVLGELRAALAKLPQAQKTAKLLEIFKGAGGTIEARRFLQNMLLTPGDLELFQNILNEMQNSSGSFEKAYSIMADSAATKSELLRNKWESLKVTIGEALMPGFLKLVSVLGKVIDWFDRLSPQTKTAISYTLAFSVAIMAVVGVLLLLVGGLAAVIAAVASAGSALLVVLGIFAAVTAAVVGFSVAIKKAWDNSKSFRSTVVDVSRAFKSLWKEHIVPTAKAIKDAWDTYMKPRLNALADVMEKRVGPIFHDVTLFIQSETFKAIKETGNLVKDILVESFKILGNIIEHMVIPAIKKITEFYNNHKKTIDDIIKAVVWLGKEFGKLAIIIGVVLAAVFVGPIIASILAFVGAILGIIAALTYLVEAVKKAISWISDNASRFWAYVTELFNSAISSITNTWNNFWNSSIGGLVKAVFGFVVATINLALTLISGIFNAWTDWLASKWQAFWLFISTIAQVVWGIIGGFITGAWNDLKNGARIAWNAITTIISDQLNKALDKVKGIWNLIRKEFDGARDWLFNAGKNFIQGFIDGVTNKINDATKIINDLAKKLKDFFPHSPAKIGPLSGRGGMFYAGQNIVKQLASGMKSITPMVNMAANRTASATVASNIASPYGSGKNVQQTFNIKTQEINPRRHAAELGWMLVGSS